MTNKLDCGHGGMKVEKRKIKDISRMENKMEYGEDGIKMDKRII